MRRQANDPYSQNANILFHTIRSKQAAKDTFMTQRMNIVKEEGDLMKPV